MIFCLAGLFAAQGCSYKGTASLTDWAIAGKIAMGDIRTGDHLIRPSFSALSTLKSLTANSSIYRNRDRLQERPCVAMGRKAASKTQARAHI